MKRSTLFILLLSLSFVSFAKPPKPPLGKRWALNIQYSDEFNGTELDLTKWYDYHPTWKGREPGLFMSSQVQVKDGFLMITGEKMETPVTVDGTVFNIKCGAVVSKFQTASFGYYECRFKANATTLSSTFWFSNRKSFDGPETCNDKFSQEWDIQECIGRGGNFDAANNANFHKGMHSNAHYWYTDCDGAKHDYRAPTKVSFDDTKVASEGFDTYGGWWKDEKSASYYYNDTQTKSHTFYDQVTATPFTQPMGMNLVVETYPYPWVELPNDAELADATKNTTYYDWVRAYTLVDVFEPLEVEETSEINNPDFETGIMSGWGGWGNPGAAITDVAEHISQGTYACRIVGGGAPEQVLQLSPNSNYRITCDAKAISGSISLGVKDNSSGITIKSTEVTSNTYQQYSLEFNTGSYSPKLYFYAQAGEEGYIDNIVVENLSAANSPVAELPEIFTESIVFGSGVTQNWDDQVIMVPFTFETNKDRDIHIELRNPQDIIIADTTITSYAGYGNAVVYLSVDSLPTSKPDYVITGDIRPLDGTAADIIDSKTLTFDLNTDTSIKGIKYQELGVYPQPVESNLFIKEVNPGTKYSVYNLSGTRILNGIYTGEPINVVDLTNGVYIIQIENQRAKFIKSN